MTKKRTRTKKAVRAKPKKVVKKKAKRLRTKKVGKVPTKRTKKVGKKKTKFKKGPRREPAFARGFKKGKGRIHTLGRQKVTADLVPPSKIQKGLQAAGDEIEGILEQLHNVSDKWSPSKVGLEVSFSADGKFLGVGVGGATSINVEFSPNDDEE